MKLPIMTAVYFRCWGIASQIRNIRPDGAVSPPAGHQVDGPAV